MTLKAVVGIDVSYLGALMTALDDYNKEEIRKQYHETLVQQETSLVTVTIFYSTIEPIQPVETNKLEFIGSTGIDPNDPDWYQKWQALQNASNEQWESQQDAIKEQAEINEDAETDWWLNTDPIHNAQEGT